MTDNNHPGYTDPLPWHLFCDEEKLTDEELGADTRWDAHCARHLRRERELTSKLDSVQKELEGEKRSAERAKDFYKKISDEDGVTIERLEAQVKALKSEIEFLSKNRAENMSLRLDLTHWQKEYADAQAKRESVELQNNELRSALADAIIEIKEWASYAGEYFQEKWDLKGNLARLQARLDAASVTEKRLDECQHDWQYERGAEARTGEMVTRDSFTVCQKCRLVKGR